MFQGPAPPDRWPNACHCADHCTCACIGRTHGIGTSALAPVPAPPMRPAAAARQSRHAFARPQRARAAHGRRRRLAARRAVSAGGRMRKHKRRHTPSQAPSQCDTRCDTPRHKRRLQAPAAARRAHAAATPRCASCTVLCNVHLPHCAPCATERYVFAARPGCAHSLAAACRAPLHCRALLNSETPDRSTLP